MRRAADILSFIGLILLFVLFPTSALCFVALAALAAVDGRSSFLLTAIVFGIAALLFLLSLILCLLGRAKVLNAPNAKAGKKILLAAGIIGVNVPLILSGALYLRSPDIVKEEA